MNAKHPDKSYKSIDELYAFVCTGGNEFLEQQGEGIMVWKSPSGLPLPMIGADLERVESLKTIAEAMAKANGIKYEIRYFKRVEKQ